ncbi:MAG: hypothetical protein V3V48_10760 [Candidatus Aminicenantaceae bacterium]
MLTTARSKPPPLDYPGLFTSQPTPLLHKGGGKAVAHEAVVNYREPTQPNPGCNEDFVVRSARRQVKNVDYE